MSLSKSSHASSSEQDEDDEADDEDENLDSGPGCRQSVMELDSEESEHNEAFFRQRRVPKRQREATPSSPFSSNSDDEQFYCRVQAQFESRRRQRREMESPIRNQNLEPRSATIQYLEHQGQTRVDSGTTQFVCLQACQGVVHKMREITIFACDVS